MNRAFPHVPSQRPKIAIVGEAAGRQEIAFGKPFVGPSGQELTRMLRDAGINRQECYITNVFWSRPPDNSIESYCATKAEVGGKDYPHPPLRPGKYLKPEWLGDVTDEDTGFLADLALKMTKAGMVYVAHEHLVMSRLGVELRAVKPNVVIALGNTACWALLGRTGITKLRGATVESTLVPGLKILPTFHPAAILRQWTNRIVAVADMAKALRESEFPEVRRPKREIWINPTLEDLYTFWDKHLAQAQLIAFDIETVAGMITCIGFASDKSHAIVVPFLKGNGHYWDAHWHEVDAWNFVRMVLQSDIPKLAQNGLYDVQYLWRAGIAVKNFTHDTMLLHHALQPELPKGLGFLGSIYTNEASWKGLRPRKLTETKGED